MNAVTGATINRPANRSRSIAGIRDRKSEELNRANNIMARLTTLPGSIARLLAGPPMTERERYEYAVAESRTLTGSWILRR